MIVIGANIYMDLFNRRAGGSTLPSELSHAWLFEEATQPWPDQVGDVDGVDGSTTPTSVTGKNGNGLQASAATGAGSNHIGTALTGDLSLSFWVKFGAPAAATQCEFCVLGGDIDSIRCITTGGTGTITLESTGGSPSDPGSAILAVDTWYNLILTKSGTTCTLYINNVLDSSITFDTGTIIVVQFGDVNGGAENTVTWDEAYIWSRALSAGERAELQTSFYPF